MKFSLPRHALLIFLLQSLLFGQSPHTFTHPNFFSSLPLCFHGLFFGRQLFAE